MPIFRFSAEANLNRPEIRITSQRLEDTNAMIRACRSAGWVATHCAPGMMENITPQRWTLQNFDYWLSVTDMNHGAVEMLPRYDDSMTLLHDGPTREETQLRTLPLSPADHPFTLGGPLAGKPRIILHELVVCSFENLASLTPHS